MTRFEQFNLRRDMAIGILQRTGISRRNYLPPIYPLLWKIGARLPPPHFAKIWVNLIVSGAPLGFVGVGFYMMLHDYESASFLTMVAVAISTTAIWGGLIAGYYEISRRIHRIPNWNSLSPSTSSPQCGL